MSIPTSPASPPRGAGRSGLLQGLRLLLAAAALALPWAGLRAPLLRSASGELAGSFVLVLAASGGLALLAAALGSRWQRSAGWIAGLLLAQALWLQLIDAGSRLHYEHWRPALGALHPGDPAMLAALGLWGAGVGVAALRRRGELLRGARRLLGGWGLLVAAAVALLPAAFPSRDLPAFAVEVVAGVAFRGIQLAALLLALAGLPASARLALARRAERLLAGGSPRRRIDPLVLGCSAWVLACSALLCFFVYDRHPHIPDEVAYLWHARYFAKGLLRVPAPAVPEAFEVYLMPCEAGGCYSPVPPGWPAALSLGVRLGAPWLVNPLLGGLSVLLLFALLRELYDRRVARLGAILLAASPWHLLVSMSFMTHTFSLACGLLAGWASVRLARTRSAGFALLAGAALGVVSLTRPLEGLALALVLGPAALCVAGRRFRLAPAALLTLSALAVGSVVLPYNAALTGDPLRFPIMAYADRVLGPGVNSLGFGPEKGIYWGGLDPFPGHGLRDVLVNDALNAQALGEEVFGWSVGSLLAVAVLLALGALGPADLWMGAVIASVIGLQSLYWYSGGPDFGARYWYLALGPLVALSARGILALAARLEGGSGVSRPLGARGALALVATAVLSGAAMLVFLPWRALDKYPHFRGMRADVRELVAQAPPGPSLWLVRGKAHPDMASAVPYNALDPAAPRPLLAWDRSPAVRRRLLAAYPDRPVWLLEGPSVTGAGYRVVAGPIPPGQALPAWRDVDAPPAGGS